MEKVYIFMITALDVLLLETEALLHRYYVTIAVAWYEKIMVY